MILKMKVEEVLKENQIEAEVFTTDVGSATSTPADIIFTSQELEKGIKDKVEIPVIGIKILLTKRDRRERIGSCKKFIVIFKGRFSL